MALALISLIHHPHPTLSHLSLPAPLAGALLISPWTSFSTTTPSWSSNLSKDIIVKQHMYHWTNAFIRPEQHDAYSQPVSAGTDWWKGAPVKRVLITSGNDEVFRDDIAVVERQMKEAGVGVVCVNCAREIHVECILDAQTGLQAGEMAHAVWEWLQGVFE